MCRYFFLMLFTLYGSSLQSMSIQKQSSIQEVERINTDDFNRIVFFPIRTGQCLRTFNDHENSVISAVFNKDETHILSCSWDTTIRIWDVRTGLCLRTLTGHNEWVQSAIYNKDETCILSCSADGTIKLWDAFTGQCLRTIKDHNSYVTSVYNKAAYNKDETHILSSSYKTIKIWNALTTGQCLHTFTGHSPIVTSPVYNKDETQILSSLGDKTIKLWDASSGNCLRTLYGHTGLVKSVVYNKDETQILSYSHDNTIKVWDIRTGLCLRTLTEHDKWVQSAIYNKAETLILSCSHDKTIKIWDNGYSYALNLASLSLLSDFLANKHPLINQSNAYDDNNLTKKLKDAVQFICEEKSNPYEVLSTIYLHIVQHIPLALRKRVLELLTSEPLQKHRNVILTDIKPLFTLIHCTTIDETKRTIEHYLRQQHLSPCMIAFIKESFDKVCLQHAVVNTLASLKHLPRHNDHQHFKDAHARAQIDELLKTNTNLTRLSGLKISTQSSLTRALEKNSAATTKPNNFPVVENEAHVQKEDLYAGLAIDSGLMHTLIPAVVLRTIEKKYKVETHKLFDCIGGSGFGALIALGLTATQDNRTRFIDPQTIVDFFYKHARMIFKSKDSKNSYYNPDNFKQIVRSYFNEVPLSDVLTHVIIPCSTTNPTKPYIFDSLEAQKSLAYDFQLKDAILAACADDCYFPTTTFEDISHAQKNTYRSYRPPYNPADDVYKVLLKKAKNNKEHIRLLSLGASFLTNQDYENGLKIIETDNHLQEKLRLLRISSPIQSNNSSRATLW